MLFPNLAYSTTTKKNLQNKPDFMISTLLVKLVACNITPYIEVYALQHGVIMMKLHWQVSINEVLQCIKYFPISSDTE